MRFHRGFCISLSVPGRCKRCTAGEGRLFTCRWKLKLVTEFTTALLSWKGIPHLQPYKITQLLVQGLVHLQFHRLLPSTFCSLQLSRWPTSSPRWAELTLSCSNATCIRHTKPQRGSVSQGQEKCLSGVPGMKAFQSKETAPARAEWGVTGRPPQQCPSAGQRESSSQASSISHNFLPGKKKYKNGKKITQQLYNSVLWRTQSRLQSVPKAQNKACSITRLSVKVPVRRSNLTEFWRAVFFRSSPPQSHSWSLNPSPRQQTLPRKACYALKHSLSLNNHTHYLNRLLSLSESRLRVSSHCWSKTSTNSVCWDRVPLPIHQGHSASCEKAADFNPVSWCQRKKKLPHPAGYPFRYRLGSHTFLI